MGAVMPRPLVSVVSSEKIASEYFVSLSGSASSEAEFLWVSAGVSRRRVGEKQDLGCCVVDAGAIGLVAGRHVALREVRDNGVIVYLDDDVTVPSGWLERMLAPFADQEVHFVGCRYLPDYEHEPADWMMGLWDQSERFRVLPALSLLDGGVESRSYDPMLVWGLCFAARRDTIIKLGGFHPDGYPWCLRRFRGDGETGLAVKAKAMGLKAYYQGGTHVAHRVPAARMTPGYFERRSFLQGISDSYTRIRREGVVPEGAPLTWRDYFRPLKRSVDRALILRRPTTEGVRRLMARAYLSGVRYHQNEARNDPSLLEWILRSNYLADYDPPSWERYVEAA